jgi:hypothetical protein
MNTYTDASYFQFLNETGVAQPYMMPASPVSMLLYLAQFWFRLPFVFLHFLLVFKLRPYLPQILTKGCFFLVVLHQPTRI